VASGIFSVGITKACLEFGNATINIVCNMNDSKSTHEALHTLNPLDRFSDRVDDYVKYRPSYPPAAIDTITAGLTTPTIAADIGAGTGISSRLLADRGVRVLAIDPNAAMRAAGAVHPFVEFREGKAEATQLEAGAVNLVTCFHAFHWFDPEPTLLEFQRILQPTATTSTTGRLALVWNNRDRTDPFTDEYSELIVAAATYPVVHDRSSYAKPLLVSPYFTNVREYTVAHHQELDLPGLIGRMRSNSYIPTEGVKLQQLVRDLEKLYDRHQDDRGLVILRYATSIHLAEPSI
jgi:SAM-dependent methyltransferase